MHVHLGVAFFIGEDCAYAAGFMNALQQCHHGFRGHRGAIFGSNNDFAFVLGAAEEEAECAFDLFLGCEFLYDFVECFVVVES
jgi:hypothetical protein